MKNKDLIIDGEVYDSETGELINKIEQVEAICVENNLPSIICKGGTHIQVNTDQLKKELIVYLEKYDIEVTEDTEKEASKKATELNTIATNLNNARLSVAKEIKKPADDLKNQVDALIEIIQGKRSSILQKVEVFKSKRFDMIRSLLEFECDLLYKLHGVDEEYKKVDIEKLVKEDSLANVGLTKKAKESLEGMVLKCKNTQSNVKIRLLELPSKSEKLSVLLTKDDVIHFLELEENEYNIKLQEMIEYRLNLELKIQENIKKEDERKAQVVAKVEEEKKVAEIEKQEEAGVKVVEVTAVFKVEVPLHVESYKVLEKYHKELSKFSTLESISIK